MINQLIFKIMRVGTILSTIGLVGSVIWQIFARFFLPSAPAWTEEASRLFFIYAIAFSAGLALEKGEFVRLEWIYEKLPTKLQSFLNRLIPLMVMALFILIGGYAIKFVRLGQAEFSPGLQFRMSLAFFSMVILGACLSYISGRQGWKMIQSNTL